MRRILSFLLMLVLFTPRAQATTNVARSKTWTAEKLYAADLNAEFNVFVTYINTHLASYTDITASATQINQLYNNRFTAAAKFVAAITDSASRTMAAGFVFTNNGRSVADSAQIDTLFSPSTGTQLGAAFYMIPLTDDTGYIGTPAKRIRSVTQDTSRATFLSATSGSIGAVTVTGTLTVSGVNIVGLDSTIIDDATIGRADLAGTIIDSTKIANVSVSYGNMGNLTIDSTKVRAGGLAGSNFSGVMTIATRLQNTGQPCFVVTPTDTLKDVDGDNSNYTVVWGTELKDQANNFATNTFTAPVTGVYLLGVNLDMIGLTSSHTTGWGKFDLSTTPDRYFSQNNPWGESQAGYLTIAGTIVVPMTKGDTVSIKITVAGGTKVVDILPTSLFFGALLF